ncbi:MAG: hypothetical protein K6C10_12265 [Prevotella sp.]|nr:hypothetical protein [Prevotella sp.]
MKKVLLTLLTLFAVSGAWAQTLKVDDVTIVPGKQATFAIVMENETAIKFRDSEFHITFPEKISAVETTQGDQKLTPGTNLIDGDYRITVVDLNGGGIEGTFTVVNVTIEAAADLAEGTYQATITSAEMTGNGNQIEGTDDNPVYEVVKKNYENITFNIIVSNWVTLDETSTTAPEAAENVNVLVKRTIKADQEQWSTICLPFAMTTDQMTAAFGEGCSLADFNDYEVVEDADGNVVGINVMFNSVTTGLAENHPYILKATKSITYDEGFKVEGVTVNPAAAEDLEINLNTPRKPHSIVGTFVPTSVPELCLFISGNKFAYSTGKTQMKGFRAYFNFFDLLTDVETEYGAKIGLFVDGEATSIEGISQQRVVEGVYDLSGRKIQIENNNLNTLQKGVYIIDGKKVTIK